MGIRIKYLPIYREFQIVGSGKYGLPVQVKQEVDSLMIDLATLAPIGSFSLFDFSLLVISPLWIVMGVVSLVTHLMYRTALAQCTNPAGDCPDVILIAKVLGCLITVNWIVGGCFVGSILITVRANRRYWTEVRSSFDKVRHNLRGINASGVFKVQMKVKNGPICFPCCFLASIKWENGPSLAHVTDNNESVIILPHSNSNDNSFANSLREDDQTQSHTSEVNLTPHGTELETEPTDCSLMDESRLSPP